MSHNKHVIDGKHLELDQFGLQWFKDVVEGWDDPLPDPIVENYDGINVVRDDLIVGSKSRFGDLLFQQIKEDIVVYVQPRVGLAGVSILDIAKRYNKKVVLFMPASKKVSHHQAVCIERGAIPMFYRIAAMPNLNLIAKKWAEENNAYFIPLGLKHPLVTAVAAQVARNITQNYNEPEVAFIATSTGVLTRGLQIGWPTTKFFSIAVSRNMKASELGRAEVISEPLEFLKSEIEENLPPFPTVNTYDAKVWKYAKKYKELFPNKDVWVWNVGKDPELIDDSFFDRIDSQREWGEVRNGKSQNVVN